MESIWQSVAEYGPWLLVAMGAWVSIDPPQKRKRGHWIWLGAFIIVGLITGYATHGESRLTDSRYGAMRGQLTTLNSHYGKIASALGMPTNARPASILSRINTLEKTAHGREWSTLPSDSAQALTAELRLLPAEPIMVGCASPNCKALADQLAGIFKDVGWQVTAHHGGGLGIDGVVGIRVDSCDGSALQISKAVEVTTSLLPNVIDTKGCSVPDDLTVGEKPF